MRRGLAAGALCLLLSVTVTDMAKAGYFGNPDPATEEAERTEKYNQQKANSAANRVVLAKIVAGKEAAARDKSAALLRDAQAEHQRQVSGFKFEARRWGDYLEIAMRRDQEGEKTYSISLRLPELTTAELEPGYEPDEQGKVRYNPTIKNATSSWFGGTTSGWSYEGPNGEEKHASLNDVVDPELWDATPNFPAVPATRSFVDLPPPAPPPQNVGCGSARGYTSGQPHDPNVSQGILDGFDGMARVAVDDRIVFARAQVTIYAPAGKGRAVLEQIMLASGKDSSGGK